MITKEKSIFMYLREHFRKSLQTNWGKNQIIEELDKLEEEVLQ